MLSCRDLVKLLSEEENATFLRRIEIRFHLLMCKHCSNYSKHLEYMRKGFKALFSQMTNVSSEKVTQLENEVIEKLKKNLDD